MNDNLVVHAGGWHATEAEVAAAPIPSKTPTYTPLPHARVIEQIKRLIPEHGMKLERLSLALSNGGARMFGVADVVNGSGAPDWGIAIGIRNSYDKSFALNLCAGSRVFVCDNLAFHGEVMLRRRHVGNVDHELPSLVAGLVAEVVEFKGEVAAQIEALKVATLTDERAHDVAIKALRAGFVTAQMLPGVVQEWHEPRHEEFAPRTAWSLFNAFTEVAKDAGPALQMRRTQQINGLFNREFARS